MNAAQVYKTGRPKHAARAPHTPAERRSRPGEAGSAAGMPQFLQRSSATRSAVPVQREEPSTALPPIPSYQLTPPSLLQQPAPPSLLNQQYSLGVSTDVANWLDQVLATPRIRSGIMGRLSLDPSSAPSPPTTASPDPTVRPEGPAPAPSVTVPPAPSTSSSSTVAPTPPLLTHVPPSAGFGIYLGMAMAHPDFNAAVTSLKRQALGGWRSLSTGQKAAVITSTAIVGVGSFSVMMSDPQYRAETLKLAEGVFNGKVVGIPFTPVSVEMKFEGSNMMFGLHLDLGSLLPERFGFGSASPVGPYPMLEMMPPLQRDADGAAEAAPDAAQRIQNATGGRPLDTGTQRSLERRLGVRLPAVQLHTDAEADRLAQSVGARAFTSGTHVFFRADAHPDTADDGLRLLAHEALHTVQQTAGPVAGTATDAGVALSDPSDRFEREATHKAAQAVPAATAAPD